MLALKEEVKNEQHNASVIEVKNLTKTFVKGSKLAAVNDVSFTVGKEVIGLFGPSGCGKTTTLRCIAGLERPDSGEIVIDGKIVTSPEKRIFVSPENRDVGLVFQSYALWPHMRVFDNVAYALRVRHIPKSEIEQRVKQSLRMVGLEGYETRYPAQLSGGQQQRVALARSLVYEPKVLLLDEPLSNLDARVRERTRIELKNLLRRIGISTVYVTHDQEEAFILSDRIAVMNEGKILQTDSPANIYDHPANDFVASFIGRSNLVEGVVIENGDDEQPEGIVRLFGECDVRCKIPRELTVGCRCSVVIRGNEIGISSDKPPSGNPIECTVVMRDYRGGATDHLVKVGETMLTVSTHRYCNLNRAEATNDKAYLTIRDGSVTVIPKTNS